MKSTLTASPPRPVTIRDVARAAHVSVASASRALNGLANVTPSTRERVLHAARALRYVPHTGARSLTTRRTDTVGLVLPDLHGEFFSEVLRGVDQAAWRRGLHLLVSNTHGDPTEAARAMRAMRGRADGLIIMSPHVDGGLLAENLPDQLPIVLMNTPVRLGSRPTLRVDNRAGALAATRHLLQLGRRRIAHIAGPGVNFEAAERREGFLAALGEAGVPPGPVLEGDFDEPSSFALTRELLNRPDRPDAIFAANDMMALGVLRALRDAGLNAPEDVAIIGFDNIPLARLVGLTTMRVDIADLGRRAVERLAHAIEGDPLAADEQTTLPELIVRESTAGRSAGEHLRGDQL